MSDVSAESPTPVEEVCEAIDGNSDWARQETFRLLRHAVRCSHPLACETCDAIKEATDAH